MASPAARRKPHCRTCGQAMAGHSRPNGVPVCPTLPSPPPTPPSSAPSSSSAARACSPERDSKTSVLRMKEVHNLGDMPFNKPDGYYHWTNPHWVDHVEKAPTLIEPPLATAGDGTLVPTVLVDEENDDLAPLPPPPPRRASKASPQPTLEDKGMVHAYVRDQQRRHILQAQSTFNEDSVSVRAEHKLGPLPPRGPLTISHSVAAVHSLMYGSSAPDAGLYSTPEGQLSMIQRGAQKLGLHVGVMSKSRPPARPLTREETWWAVVGKNKEAVEHLLHLKASHVASGMDPKAAPGSIGLPMEQHNLGTPRGLVFQQLMVASMVGAFLMFYLLLGDW